MTSAVCSSAARADGPGNPLGHRREPGRCADRGCRGVHPLSQPHTAAGRVRGRSAPAPNGSASQGSLRYPRRVIQREPRCRRRLRQRGESRPPHREGAAGDARPALHRAGRRQRPDALSQCPDAGSCERRGTPGIAAAARNSHCAGAIRVGREKVRCGAAGPRDGPQHRAGRRPPGAARWTNRGFAGRARARGDPGCHQRAKLRPGCAADRRSGAVEDAERAPRRINCATSCGDTARRATSRTCWRCSTPVWSRII